VALASIAFKEALLELEEALNDARSDLYEALNEDLGPTRIKQVLNAGKKCIATYESLLTKLSDTQRKRAEIELGEHLETVRARVKELSGRK
jgi:hypothetical protein